MLEGGIRSWIPSQRYQTPFQGGPSTANLMNNSLDTSGTRQQMVSCLSAFSKAAKAHSEDQHPESKQAPDQHPEDKSGDSTSTSDSSEARDPIARKNDPGSDSSEAPAKPPSKRPRKRQREHTPLTSSSESHYHRKRHHRRYSSSSSSSSSSFSSSSSSPETSFRSSSSFSGC